MTVFKAFEELCISTQTVIADCGVTMEIDEFFQRVPIDDVEGGGVAIQADAFCSSEETTGRRGKKDAVVPEDVDEDLMALLGTEPYRENRLVEDDMWIRLLPHIKCRAMYFKNAIKVHPGLSFQKRERYFRNALNVVLSLGNKLVNFKLSKNGKFQITGCKYLWHAQICIVAFLQRIRRWCPMSVNANDIRVYFQTVMTNMDFNIGHTIDRRNLDELINRDTMYYSLLETSFGYTGVNIKLPIRESWWEVFRIPVVTIAEDGETITCEDTVLDRVLTDADRVRLMSKPKYNTFLVFHSGNVIMSGMAPQLMKSDYETFTGLLLQWSKYIREKILDK